MCVLLSTNILTIYLSLLENDNFKNSEISMHAVFCIEKHGLLYQYEILIFGFLNEFFTNKRNYIYILLYILRTDDHYECHICIPNRAVIDFCHSAPPSFLRVLTYIIAARILSRFHFPS